MYSWKEAQLDKQRRQELLREAGNERLARLTRTTQRPSRPAYGPLLAELGRQLARLGESLQEQYEAPGDLATES